MVSCFCSLTSMSWAYPHSIKFSELLNNPVWRIWQCARKTTNGTKQWASPGDLPLERPQSHLSNPEEADPLCVKAQKSSFFFSLKIKLNWVSQVLPYPMAWGGLPQKRFLQREAVCMSLASSGAGPQHSKFPFSLHLLSKGRGTQLCSSSPTIKMCTTLLKAPLHKKLIWPGEWWDFELDF